jgi:hypothetical protein
MCYRSECPIQIGFILNSLDYVSTSFVVAASELRLCRVTQPRPQDWTGSKT